MGKIGLVIKREYNSRVKNKTFIILSLLMPALIAVLIMVPVWVQQSVSNQVVIKVIDQTHFFGKVLKKENKGKIVQYDLSDSNANIDHIAPLYDEVEDTIVLFIKKNFMSSPLVELYNNNHPGLLVINKVKEDLHQLYRKIQIYHKTKINLDEVEASLPPVTIDYQGEGMEPKMRYYVALSASFLMYLMIMIYGVQVMKAVMEEKTSRIIEIIVSSIKPVKLLWGKIIGISLIGITQFVLIALITSVIFIVLKDSVDINPQDIINARMDMMDATGNAVQSDLLNLDPESEQTILYIEELKSFVPTLLIVMPFLFIGGFLLYSSLFAAAGAAVDSETDTQQFVLPITLPILASIFISLSVLQNPNSDLAFWASLIPFSSPIVMAARLPFMDLTQDWWQIVICIVLLIGTVTFTMKIAGKIYKVGILMYGQKASFKKVFQWLKNSN